MSNYLKINMLAVFLVWTFTGFGQETEKVTHSSPTVEEKHISLNEFPRDMGINYLDDWGKMVVSYNEIPAGTDFSPLLEGLKNNSCQVPHWGYVLEGVARTEYEDGKEVILKAGDLYYMPPGHNLVVLENFKVLEFSPQEEYHELLDHLGKKMAEMSQK